MTVKDATRRVVSAARGVCAPEYLCGWCPDYSTRDRAEWEAHHAEHDGFVAHAVEAIEVSR